MQFLGTACTLAGHDTVMDQAGNIALSGLQAASLRLDAAASNIVNGGSPVSVSQSPAPGGGVSASLQPAAPSSLLAYDSAAPFANMPAQILDLKQAQNDFRASLLAYKASSQMFKTLLDATA